MKGAYMNSALRFPGLKSLFLILSATLLTQTVAQDPVRVATGWGGAELAAFVEVLEASGVPFEILNISTETDLGPLVAGGNAPDIAQMPRPGQVASFARDGAIVPLTSGDNPIIDPDFLAANQSPGVIDVGRFDGELFGLMVKISSKGTFFYRPDSLAALGLGPPTTFDELIALGDAYVANGQVPFSMPAQDGWVLTDYFETLYINTAGPDNYHKLFVTHEVEWTDPTVVRVMELLHQIFDPADERIAGGVDGALATGFRDGINLVFREDPAAELFYSGSFVAGIVESTFEGLTCGEDFDFFDFPVASDEFGSTLMGGGDLIMAFNDRPEVRELMTWLAGVESATIWATAEEGAILSPNVNVPPESYSPCTAKEAAQIAAADVFVFDGSDLAPGAVGGDAMFTALQDFLAEPDELMDILEFLEDAADAAY